MDRNRDSEMCSQGLQLTSTSDVADKASDRPSSTGSSILIYIILLALCSILLVACAGHTTSNQGSTQSDSAQSLSVPLVASPAASEVPTLEPTITDSPVAEPTQTAGTSTAVPSDTPPVNVTVTTTATSPAIATPTSYATYVPSPSPDYLTPIAATRVAYASAVAENMEALQTAVALTQEPTDIPGPPSPVASPTPMLGILPGCSNTNAYEPQAISCWRGVVGGQLVDVDAGREGRSGDMSQGIIRVHTEGQQGEDVYPTPSKVGAVRIVSVSGIQFTLSTVELPTPEYFVFDLDTRQWTNP
jgi:hypothetical protein